MESYFCQLLIIFSKLNAWNHNLNHGVPQATSRNNSQLSKNMESYFCQLLIIFSKLNAWNHNLNHGVPQATSRNNSQLSKNMESYFCQLLIIFSKLNAWNHNLCLQFLRRVRLNQFKQYTCYTSSSKSRNNCLRNTTSKDHSQNR